MNAYISASVSDMTLPSFTASACTAGAGATGTFTSADPGVRDPACDPDSGTCSLN